MNRIPVLMYHQIDKVPPKFVDGVKTPFRGLIVSPKKFARQMWLLKKLGYTGLSMGQLTPYLRGDKAGKVVGLTFDDGYQNNLTHALPVLRKFKFSATCYRVSDATTNVWDASIGIASKLLMTADDCRQWIAGGQEIGSHTRNHVDLNAVSDEAAFGEILESKKFLEVLTGVACEHFCYPYGRYSARHVKMAREAGYITATTTAGGHASADAKHDLLELPRQGIWKSTNSLNFLSKVLWR